jgi:hypothetical protein
MSWSPFIEMCVRAYIYSLISEVNTEDQQSDLVLLEGWASEEPCKQIFKPTLYGGVWSAKRCKICSSRAFSLGYTDI